MTHGRTARPSTVSYLKKFFFFVQWEGPVTHAAAEKVLNKKNEKKRWLAIIQLAPVDYYTIS